MIRLSVPPDLAGQVVEVDVERTSIPRYVVVRSAGTLRRIDLASIDEAAGQQILHLSFAARRGQSARFIIEAR